MAKQQLAVLVNKKDEVVGYKGKLEVHAWPALLHRAVSVVVFNGDKVLLQRRSAQKAVWPLFWSNSCCGNVLKGETYAECANRRLREEMGVQTNLKESYVFSYKAKYDKNYGENEIDHVFVGEYSGKVTPDPAEASGYKWVSKKSLQDDLKTNPDKYTPWFKLISKKLF
jgi:isopentenyl-diphosphate delta-isomerase